MAWDPVLAERLRGLLAGRGDVVEKRMFGGLTFMVSGHMCCGVAEERLMFRVGPRHYGAALARPQVGPCDFTGRPMKGLVLVAGPGVASESLLAELLTWSLDFVATLPARG